MTQDGFGYPVQYDSLLFDNTGINQDQDYLFKLRGHSENLLVDAATPLLGLVLRLRQLSHCDNISTIYQRVVDDIKAIETELNNAGLEPSVIVSYRYVLCSFMDESVMGTAWGADSVWAEHSLLTRFHNETWGGEKVYTILNRLISEPERYRDLLSFIYVCLSLGFEGRYRVMASGRDEHSKIIRHLYETLDGLRKKKSDVSQPLTDQGGAVNASRYRVYRPFPISIVLVVFIALWGGIYAYFSTELQKQTQSILEQISLLMG